jgi:hypothetical protein
MTRTIKAEYMPGGEKRQEMLDKAVDYIREHLDKLNRSNMSFV